MLGLLVAWIAVLLSPGPDVFQIIRVGSRSRRAGVLCALGIMTGNTGWALASWLGLAALPAQAIAAVQILGGAFLVWMGVQAVRPAPAPAGAGGDGSAPPAQPRERNPFLVGLVTNLANPKALLFFAAIFAQYGDSFWAVALVCSTGFIYFIGFALLVDKISPLLQRLGPWLDRGAGILFIIFGLIIAVGGFSTL
ncbi:putative threonine efflux protein [Corynebacterium renale]|uniref:LysE family translocator n=1 Tax=Corynebacterium renale TaxID=1724 RepID=UPI000DA3AD43|nr:LysE family translocator [Corynebacterium renale]SQG63760.1 putative threonine efflux protein [Corynebacterium renale]STD02021.1 putative threonine efflux protein [Corynebacterium renale]